MPTFHFDLVDSTGTPGDMLDVECDTYEEAFEVYVTVMNALGAAAQASEPPV